MQYLWIISCQEGAVNLKNTYILYTQIEYFLIKIYLWFDCIQSFFKIVLRFLCTNIGKILRKSIIAQQ